MSKLWEVDPETRAKLGEIAKTNENNRCIDCGAPSPQWASPKLGIFFCLACSGIHRSLGVHISFVRSVTMDAFKLAEVRRMSLGGNAPYKTFFDSHPSNSIAAREFESCTIAERYDCEAGEEWKERLTAKVEEREYVPGAAKREAPARKVAAGEMPGSGSGRSTPQGGQRGAGAQGFGPESQKSKNEAYFASKGAENASRSADLAPSQGGKYSGFGSAPPPSNNSDDFSSAPSTDDFQKDPVAALTKGFGWLGSSFAKQAASVNKAYIQPGISNINTTDWKQLGNNVGAGLQQTTRGLNDQFTKFVDPQTGNSGGASNGRAAAGAGGPEKKDFWDSFGADPAGPPREKKDFWDDFAAAGEASQASQPKARNVGTSAMKSGGGGGQAAKKDEEGGWGDW